MRFCCMVLIAVWTISTVAFSNSVSGLEVSYDFDSAEVIDGSGNGRNGTLHNVSWHDGVVEFERGKSSYIDLGSRFLQSLSSPQAVTVSLWFYHVGTPVDADYMFLASADGRALMEVYITSNALRVCGRSSADDNRLEKKYPPVENNRWYHLVATWDYKNKKILTYLNGQKLTHEGGSDNAGFGSGSLTIKAQNSKSTISSPNIYREFNGFMDEFRLYSRTLTQEEISQLCSAKEISTKPTAAQITAHLTDRLKDAVVMAAGCDSAFAGNRRYLIDPKDTRVAPFVSEGRFFVPVEFIADYYNKEIDLESAISLYGKKFMEAGEASKALGIPYIKNGELVIFSGQTEYINEVCERLTRQSYIRPVGDSAAGAKVVARSDEVGLYLGSPSIAKLASGRLIITHDYFGGKNKLTTMVYKSDDNGLTWQQISSVAGCTWATVFEHRGCLYLMGTGAVYGSAVIFKSDDEGETWSQGSNILPPEGKYHSAPVPIVKHNGRIYRAYESGVDGQTASALKALMVSADENSDLLDPSSWRVSNEVGFDKSLISHWQYANAGWLEGNAVVTPQGEVVNILRTTIAPHSDKAAVLHLDTQSMALTAKEIINLPGGSHKFSIKYDDVSGKYIALVNNNTDKEFFNQRNVLSLVYSYDLKDWYMGGTILSDDSILSREESALKIGYQYVDYIIDGNDLKMAVRQASDGAMNYHDSNQIVYCRIPNFRNLLNSPVLLAMYDFEQIEGLDVSDITGSGFDAVLSNDKISITNGYMGQGMEFSAVSSNTHLSVSKVAQSLNGKTGITVGMWVNFSGADNLNRQLFKICLNGSTGAAMAYINTSGKVVFEARSRDGESIRRITSDNALSIGEWHHIAFVVDYAKKRMQYYLDGKLSKWTNVAQFENNVLVVGSPPAVDTMFGGAGSSVFAGKMDEVFISPAPLGESQIKSIIKKPPKLLDSQGKELGRLQAGELRLRYSVNLSEEQSSALYIAVYDKKTMSLADVILERQNLSAGSEHIFDVSFKIPPKFYDRVLKVFLLNEKLQPLGKGGIIYETE